MSRVIDVLRAAMDYVPSDSPLHKQAIILFEKDDRASVYRSNRLSRTEQSLFDALKAEDGAPVAYDLLIAMTGIATQESLCVHKFRLRAKLERKQIGTIHSEVGIGYRLELYNAAIDNRTV